jgi:hypothetical protein
MFAFLQLLGTFVASLFRPRRGLEVENLSFPKIPSARIRALRQNQSIILGDACMPSAA